MSAGGVDRRHIESPSDESMASPPEQSVPVVPARPRRPIAVVGVAGPSSASGGGDGGPSTVASSSAVSTPTVGVRARVSKLKLTARSSKSEIDDADLVTEVTNLRQDLIKLRIERDKVFAEYSTTNEEHLKVKTELNLARDRLIVASKLFCLFL